MATDYYKMGLGLGGAYFDGKEDKRQRDYQDEKRARETTQFNDQQAELQYQRTQRQGVDDAFANVQGLQTNGVYAGGNTSGMSDGSAEMLFKQGGQPLVDETASYANVENRRRGLAPAQTTSAPNAPTVQSRKATGLDMNRAMLGVATAKKDIGAMQSLQTQGKELEWDDEFGTRLKDYKGTPEQIAESSKYTNSNSKTLTVGSKDKAGFIEYSVTRPDGSALFSKLSVQDQAQMYAAGGMMQKNPTKALAILSGINKELAASVAADNGLEQFLGKNSNDVASKRGDLADKAAGRAETSRHNRAAEGLQGQSLGIQRDRANAAKKEAPNPELVAKYNDLMIQSEEAKDPKVRAELDQQMRRLAAQISTGMGKPMQVRSEGKPMAPLSPIEEAGKGYRDNATGGIKYADGRGGYVAEGGVMPQDRALALKKAKVPDNLIGQLPWNADGTSVGFAGQAYKVNDPEDMRALAKDYARLNGNAIAVDEAQKMDNHYMNNPAKTYGRSGSIYDTPEQRAAHTRAYDARNQ